MPHSGTNGCPSTENGEVLNRNFDLSDIYSIIMTFEHTCVVVHCIGTFT